MAEATRIGAALTRTPTRGASRLPQPLLPCQPSNKSCHRYSRWRKGRRRNWLHEVCRVRPRNQCISRTRHSKQRHQQGGLRRQRGRGLAASEGHRSTIGSAGRAVVRRQDLPWPNSGRGGGEEGYERDESAPPPPSRGTVLLFRPALRRRQCDGGRWSLPGCGGG